MPISPQTDARLASAAHAADRKNRPLVVIVVASILLLGAAAYAAASYYIMQEQGRRSARFEQLASETEEDYEEIRDVRADFPDLGKQFPQDRFFHTNVQEYAAEVLEDHGVETDITASEDQRRWPLSGTKRPLVEVESQVQLVDIPLTAVLDYIERVLTDPDRKYDPPEVVENVFLHSLKFTPRGNSSGWTAVLTFKSVQHDPRR